MRAPIDEFIKEYIARAPLRLHMPGHKGSGDGKMDLTEIEGADSLYEARGIIRESEENASRLFGCPTFYSTEGSSLCIRAMLQLFKRAYPKGRLLAAPNAHKTFLSGIALLDIETDWLWSESFLSCPIDLSVLEKSLQKGDYQGVYITGPDYLGHMAEVAKIAEICHRNGALLLVDNAHGAYLKFLEPSLHPIDLGADLCCDSAHKTLPVLTGGAYLHLSPALPKSFAEQAKNALALFGSTSPSYLILRSLDLCNLHLLKFKEELASFIPLLEGARERLEATGWRFLGDEPLKWTLDANAYGYEGEELARLLAEQDIICEYADRQYLTMMLAPIHGAMGMDWLEKALMKIPKKASLCCPPPRRTEKETALSPREAMIFSQVERLPIEECEGKILAEPSVGCPPAVPILICGQRIDKAAIEAFRYYGISHCTVIKEQKMR